MPRGAVRHTCTRWGRSCCSGWPRTPGTLARSSRPRTARAPALPQACAPWRVAGNGGRLAACVHACKEKGVKTMLHNTARGPRGHLCSYRQLACCASPYRAHAVSPLRGRLVCVMRALRAHGVARELLPLECTFAPLRAAASCGQDACAHACAHARLLMHCPCPY